ncbi:MAG TPA: hypothetical protein VNX47_03935 [Nevskia sp.]|jgi:hypothetical protein|nr:hypothetical protein [Nevskia sp.]
MSKNRIFIAVASSLVGTSMASSLQASSTAVGFAAPSGVSVAASLPLGVPAEFSMLIWAPVLLITFACCGYLLWLIVADARQNRPRAANTGIRVQAARLSHHSVGLHR